jgi:hypothetical protein
VNAKGSKRTKAGAAPLNQVVSALLRAPKGSALKPAAAALIVMNLRRSIAAFILASYATSSRGSLVAANQAYLSAALGSEPRT